VAKVGEYLVMTTDIPSILVVDDEQDTCRNVADICEELGYRVDVAFDGPTALELIRKRPYDIALLDFKMPGMDGLTLYRSLKKVRAGTVAIMVTGFASATTDSEARGAGVWHVVPKPVDFPPLLALMSQAVQQPLMLVVDDDNDFCLSLWDLMREQGYRVCLAHDETEAMVRMKEQDYKVVLIDMKLPVGDGASVFEMIHTANPLARTILITGHRVEMHQLVEQVIAHGADAVCYKPFDVPQLLRTIDRLANTECEAAAEPSLE
jgi:CheY-like chemotaxis protein